MVLKRVDLARLHERLVQLAPFADLAPDKLQPMATHGISNQHVRLGDRGWIVRLPRGRFHAMPAHSNIEYHATSFLRLAPSGCVPRLRAVLQPGPGVPLGGLVVREIRGRRARVGTDLPAVARSLAAIHSLPMPPRYRRPPLIVQLDPVRHLATITIDRWKRARASALHPVAAAMLRQELAWAYRLGRASDPARLPRCLVVVDSHLGNFIVDAAGRAVLIDIDQVYYGAPMADVARASLPHVSHLDQEAVDGLGHDVVLAFERAWLALLPPDLAAAARPLLRSVRRLLWLALLGELAAQWLAADGPTGPAEDAFEEDDRRRARAAVDFHLDPANLARMRAQWLGPDRLPDP